MSITNQTKLERTNTLYISSENVDYFTSSNRVTIPLAENLSPADGYNLVYCVKSVGFNSTVYNISEEQGNNRLTFAVDYDVTAWQAALVQGSSQPLQADGHRYNIYKTADYPGQYPTPPTTVTHELIVPDGLYTLSQLFAFLSTSSDGSVSERGKHGVYIQVVSREHVNLDLLGTILKTALAVGHRPQTGKQ